MSAPPNSQATRGKVPTSTSAPPSERRGGVPNSSGGVPPRGRPRLYGDAAPQPPAPAPSSSSAASGPSSEHQQKQKHLIYHGFNEKLLLFLRALKKRLPHDRLVFDAAEKVMCVYADEDITTPMKHFADAVRGHEDCLRQCTPENVSYFLEHVQDVSLIRDLRIKENWTRFKPRDLENLWKHFGGLLNIYEMTNMVDVDLMTAVQNMSLQLERNAQLRGLASGDSAPDPKEIGGLLLETIQNSPDIMAGLQRMVAANEGMDASQAPPAFAKLFQQYGGTI